MADVDTSSVCKNTIRKSTRLEDKNTLKNNEKKCKEATDDISKEKINDETSLVSKEVKICFINESNIDHHHVASSTRNEVRKSKALVESDNNQVSIDLPDQNEDSVAKSDIKNSNHVELLSKQHGAEDKSSCGKHNQNEEEIQKIKDDMAQMNSLINKLLHPHDQQNERNTCKSDIKMLLENNNKMAAKIDILEMIIDDIAKENTQMKSVLGIKQNKWCTVVEGNGKKSNEKPPANRSVVQLSNPFEVLEVEDTTVNNDDIELTQSDKTRETNQSEAIPQHQSSSQSNTPSEVCEAKPSTDNNKATGVLVIGDSMIKNIKTSKISFAAKTRATCRTYRGAKINKIHENLNNEWPEKEPIFHGTIIHAGTNDLVGESTEEAINDMEKLITDVKSKPNNVAISSVTERFDHQVPPSKVNEFNNLLNNLCQKHDIEFINNNQIDKTMLNGSNLHLNRNGDKVLGKSFCDYFRSIRLNKHYTSNHNDTRNFRAVRQWPNRPKGWSKFLKFVHRVTSQ